MDCEPTAKVIDEMAGTLSRYANELSCIAAKMRVDGDLSRAGDALTAFSNMVLNCRLDLLAVRPIREFERAKASK